MQLLSFVGNFIYPSLLLLLALCVYDLLYTSRYITMLYIVMSTDTTMSYIAMLLYVSTQGDVVNCAFDEACIKWSFAREQERRAYHATLVSSLINKYVS